VDEVRMCDGRRFQADGAATDKELLESWRLNRGTIKSKQPKVINLVLKFLNKRNCLRWRPCWQARYGQATLPTDP